MASNNVFSNIPTNIMQEVFEDLLNKDNIRIERIISQGQVSPESGWYDQEEHEWVLVLEGAGKVLFEDGNEVSLEKGDYINILKHTKHKVSWTDPKQVTIWLAVFYN